MTRDPSHCPLLLSYAWPWGVIVEPEKNPEYLSKASTACMITEAGHKMILIFVPFFSFGKEEYVFVFLMI